MSKILAILKKRRYIFGYIKKYSAFVFRRICYDVRRHFHVDVYEKTADRISILLKIPRPNLGEYTRKHMVCSLLHPDLMLVLEKMKSLPDFMKNLNETTERILSRETLILNRFINNVYDADSGHYLWLSDFATGVEYKLTHYTVSRAVNKIPGVDVKNLWELSRMQYLFAPALMFRLTGDERYAQFVRDTMLDWISCNKFEEGPNWQPSMESGIRSANMMLAFQLIADSTTADDLFYEKILSCAYLHQQFILQNEENIGGRTSNHYLGAMTGIACIATTFPFLPNEEKVREYAFSSFSAELLKQVLPDGSGFEGSTTYQQLIGEMFCVARTVFQHTGDRFSQAFDERLSLAADFCIHMSKHDGTLVQIGDNDGGHIFRLLQTKEPDGSLFITLTDLLLTGRIRTSDFPPEIMMFGGVPKSIGVNSILKSDAILFPNAGITVYDDRDMYMTFAAVDVCAYEMGGHTHSDKLSVTLSVEGLDFFVDPGSGTYTGAPKIRNHLRSTTSHSTVQVEGLEQCGIPKSGALFALDYFTRTLSMNIFDDDNTIRFDGKVQYIKDDISYDHFRTVSINKKRREIDIIDEIITNSEKVSSAICRFVLHPKVTITNNKSLELILIHDHVRLSLRSDSIVSVNVVEGFYSSNYGQVCGSKIIELPFRIDNGKGILHCIICCYTDDN